MKLFFLCTFIAVLGLVRSLEIKCTHDFIYYFYQNFGFTLDHDDIDEDTSCVITDIVTIKTDDKVKIVSELNLNSINRFTFFGYKDHRSQISMVPKEIFEQLSNLTFFNLVGTVKALNNGDFEKAGKLKHLAINNQLKKIPAGVLGSAKNLEKLILSDNQIADIEDRAFSGLNALLRIDLRHNKLTILKRNMFTGLEKLKSLDLRWNLIESIEGNALILPKLKTLRLHNNKLTTLPDHLFFAIPLLEYFSVSGNEINDFGKTLYGLKNLKTLYLSNNKLSGVDLVAFSQMPALKRLYLNGIGLTSENISKIEIKEPSKSILTYLSLADNEVTNNDDWKKLSIFHQLETINVRNTKYSKIDLGTETLRKQFPKLTGVLI